jgi:RNAse (barnase) inhibitor barstar
MDTSSIFIVYKKGHAPTIENSLLALLDGNGINSMKAFYKQLAVDLKFPDYFSNNLDSLDEVLNDLSWVDEKKIVLNIKHTSQFLSNEPNQNIRGLMKVLSNSINQWKEVDDKDESKKELQVLIEQSDRMDRILKQSV